MRSVLLVDDDAGVISGLRALLSLESIPTSFAMDAESAEAMISQNFYAVVMADLRLRSDEDGLRLIETIRRVSPASKVAAMTGYATPETEHIVFGIGASRLLRKPFSADDFLSTVRELRVDDLDVVYRETGPRLRAMVRRRYGLGTEQSEDILQQAWCVLLEKRREIRDIGAWLAGTMLNLSRQTIQRCARDRSFAMLSCDDAAYDLDAVTSLAVNRALARLDERSRRLCELIGIEQFSYQEVADQLGLPLGSIGPLYMRAKARLRQELTN
jgi:RNA polymerase sigma factor (sigma-70 family)